MTQDAKIILGTITAAAIILVGAVFFLGRQQKEPLVDTKTLLGNQSHFYTPTQAEVTIVEFGDYQCPACALSEPAVKEVLLKYGSGKVNFVFRNFPLNQHKNALIAAKAAEAAGEQGKFWQMHDKLYINQNQWAESSNPLEIFVGFAKDLGLDIEKFQKAVASNKYTAKIQEDQNDGIKLGVSSTPTFFINGKKLDAAPTFANFQQAIEPEL